MTILIPILRDLGWDPHSGADVLYEHSVTDGAEVGRVDIALIASDGRSADGRCVALIEAKAPSADLAVHVEQVLGYASYTEVHICVLTNGTEWWLYLPREFGGPEGRRFATLRLLDDPVERLSDDLQAFLGKQNLIDGQAESRAQRVLTALRRADRLNSEAPRIWKKMRDTPDEELAELLNKRVYEEVGLRLTPMQITAVLNGDAIPPDSSWQHDPESGERGSDGRTAANPLEATQSARGRVRKPRIVTPKPTQVSRTGDRVRKPRKVTPKPTGVVLWGQHRSVNHFVDILKTVAEILYERHAEDYENVLSESKSVRSGRPYIHREPERFISAHRIRSSPYFLNINLNAEKILKRSVEFLVLFGYSPDDLEVIYNQSPSPAVIAGHGSGSKTTTTKSEVPPPSPEKVKPRQPKKPLKPTPKPTGVVLLGERRSVNHFLDILVIVAEMLYERHAEDYERVLSESRSARSGRPYIHREPERFISAHRIRSSPYFLNIKLSAKDIFKRSRLFLELFGYSPDDLEVIYNQSPSPAVRAGHGSASRTTATRSEVPPPSPEKVKPREPKKPPKVTPKPTGVVLLGERRSVNHFVDILKTVAEVLYERHPHDFDQVLCREPYVSREPGTFKRPQRIAESAYFLNIDLNAKNIFKRSRLFLELFGYSPDDLEVIYDQEPKSGIVIHMS